MDKWKDFERVNTLNIDEDFRIVTKWFKLVIYNGGGWFRLLGCGLGIADRVKHPPLFSERTGLSKCLRLGKWSIWKLELEKEYQK
jgi:hypothetical protein